MKMYTKLFLLVLLFKSLLTFSQEKDQNQEKMEWFQDAKLGVFIHWGIYSVNGISESWSFFNNYINHENYMKQLDGFTASNYDPKNWVQLIKNSGAKYAVITTKHHDGVALWNTKAENSTSIPKNALAKKDVLTPFVEKLKKSGLKTGLYFSLADWSHPYYDVFTRIKKRYDVKDEPEQWEKFIQYYQLQLSEISQQYYPDLLWFDGNWEHSPEEWKSAETIKLLQKYNPNIIINSRLDNIGDYETPEQGIPTLAPKNEYWELCYTMNDSWGFQPVDTNYKTPNMIVRTFVDCISMGGNLLIDIGPKADGTIPTEQIEILKNLGRWTSKHSEAIYETRRGISFENYIGKSTISKDGKKLYIYIDEVKDFITIKGLVSFPKSVKIVGDEQANILFKKEENNTLNIELSKVNFDPDVTVIELAFDQKMVFEKPSISTVSLDEILTKKNTNQAVYAIANALHNGNNILDNIGLTPDGMQMTIPTNTNTNTEILQWISKHSEALYQTEKGLMSGHFSGMSALSKDKQTLYLFVEGKPTGAMVLKGLKNNISRIHIVGEGSIISHEIHNKLYWSQVPGIVYIDIPKDRLDKNLTIIAILIDKPIELYRENVGTIESNL